MNDCSSFACFACFARPCPLAELAIPSEVSEEVLSPPSPSPPPVELLGAKAGITCAVVFSTEFVALLMRS